LICYWLKEQRPGDWMKITHVYQALYATFGDSLLCHATYPNSQWVVGAPAQSPRKVVLRRILITTNQFQRQESMDYYPDTRPRSGGGTAIFPDSQNFDYFADMGVPSDIFEPSDEALEKQEQDYSYYFKPRVLSISGSVGLFFPTSRPLVCRPRALRLKLGPCRQLEPDKYAQKGTSHAPPGKRNVPWRHFAVGHIHRCQVGRNSSRRLFYVPDYADMLLCP
jgi:hypothetical protein